MSGSRRRESFPIIHLSRRFPAKTFLYLVGVLCSCGKDCIMGLDADEKILADYNDVFADIMNVLLYDGKEVISENDLENTKDRSLYKIEGIIHEQERDVSKIYRNKEMRLAFLGIEHQNKSERFMPLRVISYDGSAYRAQLLRSNGVRHC